MNIIHIIGSSCFADDLNEIKRNWTEKEIVLYTWPTSSNVWIAFRIKDTIGGFFCAILYVTNYKLQITKIVCMNNK